MAVAEGCTNGCGHVQTAQTALSHEAYTGEAVQIQWAWPENWAGTRDPQVKYRNAAGQTISAPVNAGSYSAEITFGKNQTVTLDFEIRKAALRAADFTLTLPEELIQDGNPKAVTVTTTLAGLGAIEVFYTDAAGNRTTDAPAEAGSYRISIDVAEGENHFAANALTDSAWVMVIQANGLYPLEGLAAGQLMEIDGKKYTADSLGRIWLDSPDHRIASTYTIVASEREDPLGIEAHSLYPVGMQVWSLAYNEGTYTMEAIPALTDLLTYQGTSIRVSGKQGIRILTSLSETKREQLRNGKLLKNTALDGYRLVEYGTIFQWLEDSADLIYDPAHNNRSVAYGENRDAVFARKNGEIWYTGVLVDLEQEFCGKEILLRSYLVLENNKGETLVLYGGTLQRSIGYVAYQNKDASYSPAIMNFLQAILDEVYGLGKEYQAVSDAISQ